ncbi:carbohydrate ABC transporter permease [Nakamurella antarctica]|uniref:Carbohydrate ABC transporter permease n=1 Tax=Nakamurella antarctica TaxID=1902245 RepID=A0A3G9A0H7_9ACTN|nr:carbohydrate ABC transporter permease [Nakamurella antarctica]AZI59291.1 carbohydrate ABC transporter permease [Nakamurella antarctica]
MLINVDGAITKPESAEPGRGPRENPVVVGISMVFMVAALFYFLLPVYILVVAATKAQPELATTSGLVPSSSFFINFGNLIARDDGVYLRWLLNSVIYAVGGAVLGTLLASLAGYALAKYKFRGRESMFNIILGGVLMPATALALPLFLIFTKVGLVNTYWAVLLPSIVSPFGVYLARIFASTAVPDELIEAGRLDGAGEFRIFFTIGTRLMAPALVTIFLFQFVAIWNNFFLPLIMLGDQDLYPVTLGLFAWQGTTKNVPELQTLVLTGSVVAVVPLVAMFLLLQRFWQSGLSAGAVK